MASQILKLDGNLATGKRDVINYPNPMEETPLCEFELETGLHQLKMKSTKPETVVKQVSLWNKAISRQNDWPDKDEFLDIIYWIRQILGIILGLVWGFIPLTGIIGLALFFITNAGIVYVYFSSFQKVDEEEFGGAWELTKEGFMTSFAGFLVTWIIVYSGMHFSDHDLQPFD